MDYGSSIVANKWQRVRIAFKANTPGVADGRFVMKYDDVTVFDITGQYFAAKDELDTFIFTNYDAKPGDNFTDPMIYVDDLEFRTGAGSFDCIK